MTSEALKNKFTVLCALYVVENLTQWKANYVIIEIKDGSYLLDIPPFPCINAFPRNK